MSKKREDVVKVNAEHPKKENRKQVGVYNPKEGTVKFSDETVVNKSNLKGFVICGCLVLAFIIYLIS